MESQNRSITECPGLEGTHRDHRSNSCSNKKAIKSLSHHCCISLVADEARNGVAVGVLLPFADSGVGWRTDLRVGQEPGAGTWGRCQAMWIFHIPFGSCEMSPFPSQTDPPTRRSLFNPLLSAGWEASLPFHCCLQIIWGCGGELCDVATSKARVTPTIVCDIWNGGAHLRPDLKLWRWAGSFPLPSASGFLSR